MAKLRAEKKLTLLQLADCSCVSLSTLKRMEKGDCIMLDIANALEVSLAHIFLRAYTQDIVLELEDEVLRTMGKKLLEEAVKQVR